MEKQESKSKWDDLARDLGADISPETVQREEAVLQASEREAAAPAASSREKKEITHAQLPKRGPADWDSLANDLGLPPSEAVAPSPPPKSETPREETRPAQRPQEREETRVRRPERSDRERKPRREQSEHQRDDRGRRGQRDDRGPRRENRDVEGDVDRTRQRHRDDVSPPEPELEQAHVEPTPSHEQPQKPATVSLWHKIFGSPAEQTPKFAEEAAFEPVAPSDLRDEPRAAGSGFADAHADEPIEFPDEFADQNRSGGSSAVGEEQAPTEHTRGPSRRRRGGRGRGRGRDSEDRPRESRPAERRDATPRSERPRRDENVEFEDDLSLDDDEAEDSLEDGASEAEDENGLPLGTGSSRSASVLQRAIPSWDEAIGFIVDSNMQSRSQRRPPSRSGSRDNSSRGRSRGRRKS
jgi:hypothetical protein